MSNKLSSFQPETINSLLKAPGKNVNTAKKNLIRQLNRTRKNTVMYKSDIDQAFKVIEYILKTKKFDLSPFQEKIVFGTPEESRIARHRLRTIAIILRDILNGNIAKYSNQPSLRQPSMKNALLGVVGHLTSLTSGAGVITLTFILISGPASSGLAVMGLGVMSLVGSLGIFAKEVMKRDKIQVDYETLLVLILKVLEEEKKRPISEQRFTMTNRNTGFVSNPNDPIQMEMNPMFTPKPYDAFNNNEYNAFNNNERPRRSLRKTRRQRK